MLLGFGVFVGGGAEVGVAVGTSVGGTGVAEEGGVPWVGVAVGTDIGAAHPANSAPTMGITAIVFLIGKPLLGLCKQQASFKES